MTRFPKKARPLAGMLALLVGFMLGAPPGLAAETPLPAPARPLAAAAAARVSTMPAAALAQAAPATPAVATGDKPFFKSTKGVLVLVLMATGVTWAAVSRSQDAVHSPGRK